MARRKAGGEDLEGVREKVARIDERTKSICDKLDKLIDQNTTINKEQDVRIETNAKDIIRNRAAILLVAIIAGVAKYVGLL